MNLEARSFMSSGLSESLFKTLFFDSTDRFVVLDDNFRIQLLNTGAAELLGDVCGGKTSAALQEFFDDISEWKKFLSLVKEENSVAGYQCLWRDKSKKAVKVVLDIKPFMQPHGQVPGYLMRVSLEEGLKTDEKTRPEQFQKVLMRMNRLASIGQITAAFVHGIKTPIYVISSMAELLLENKLDPQAREYVQMIAHNAKKTYQSVGTILDYSKNPDTRLEKLSLTQVIQSTCDMLLGNFHARQVELICCLNPIPEVMADANQIREALCNILINSLEATAPDGRVTVSTDADDKKRLICIRVKDNGSGVAEDVLPRLCQPFFSTKEGGTGLGLYLVGRIMKGHGGSVSIGGKKGTGTTVTLTLPAV